MAGDIYIFHIGSLMFSDGTFSHMRLLVMGLLELGPLVIAP